VGTTIIIKMGKARYAWVTILPLCWLVVVTMSAGWAKLFSPDPRLGFISAAASLEYAIEVGRLPAGVPSVEVARRLVYNNYLDAGVAAFFMVAVVVILADSIREWVLVISGRKPAVSSEVPHPGDAADRAA
jgi:carbon starvation protein